MAEIETIIAKVNLQDIDILSCPKLVSKSRKLYKVHFHFDESWTDFINKAVFKTRSTEKEMALVNNECYVPWECLEEHRIHLSIGIYGVHDDITKPTVWSKELFIYPGAGMAEEAREPTPDVYQQFVNQIEAGMLQGPPGPAGNAETWEFELEDGTIYTRTVYVAEQGGAE